jgi:ATP-dependent RNA circularization protein (DNA/RNA ligase family)
MQRKTDDHETMHFHAHRIHNLNGKWYFLTRRGSNIGPFESKRQAEKALALFLSGVRNDSSN